MKKICMLVVLLLAAALVLCACAGDKKSGSSDKIDTVPSGESAVKVTGDAAARPDNTPFTADGSGYDNSVRIVDGSVSGSSFNWEFFVGKSGAGRLAQITIISSVNGSEERMTLEGGLGEFTLERAGERTTYPYLVSFTADLASGTANLCVITDNPEISAEDFFGGAVPSDARVGDAYGHGVVVFTDYR